MQVVILAGGLGTRLGPLTKRQPKALINVCGKPFIQYQLNWLARYGLRDVVLCVGFLGDQIKAFAGKGRIFGMRITYSFEEDGLLGTAGALRKAAPLLEEKFCVLNGDSYLPINPLEPIQHFQQKGFIAMMLTFRNRGRFDSSNVSVQKGLVTAYSRRQGSGMKFIDYGMQTFRKQVLQLIPPEGFCNLDVLYEKLIAQHKLVSYIVHEPFYEIGSSRGLARFRRYVEKAKV